MHKEAGLQAHPRLTVTRVGELTAPALCRHCDDAPCAQVCPVRAIEQKNNAVELNETLCIGCKLCAIACPFGSITPSATPVMGVVPVTYNYFAPKIATSETSAATDGIHSINPILAWTAGVKTVAVKCDLCDFRPEGPECVRVCPTRALFSVPETTLSDSNEKKQRLSAEALNQPLTHLQAQEPTQS